jgi:hypothetical protein
MIYFQNNYNYHIISIAQYMNLDDNIIFNEKF